MVTENNDLKKSSDKLRNGIVFTAIGFELVGIMVFMLYVGQYLDKNYGWGGLGVAGLSMVGLGGWIAHLAYLLKGFKP